WGFDPITRTVIAPTTDDVGDLMSYRTRRWPSVYTWNAIKAEAPNSPSRGDFTETNLSAEEMKIIGVSPQLLVAGMIDTKSAQVQAGPFILFPPGTAPSQKVLRAHSDARQLRQKGDASYSIRLMDGGGTVLAESPLVTRDIMDDESSEIVGFGQYVGFVEGTASIRFLSGLDILDERFVSAHAPVLTLGPVSLDSDSLGLRWSATDEDGDSLHYTVQYSSDDGVHYSTLVSGYPFTQFRTRAEVLAGSENARLRVIASDGVLSDVEVTPVFNLPRHAPVVSIGGVRNGDRLPYGSSLNLLSTAMDPEDGNIAEGYLSWNAAYNYLPYSSGGESIFHLDSPEPGLFFVDLAATDSDGNSASEHVSFEILPLVVPDGPAVPVLDGTATGDEYAGATEVRIPLGDGAFATAYMLHCGGRLCLLINNLKTGSGTQATFTGIRIDANASGDHFAQGDDRGFFVNENGIPSMAGGDGIGDMPILSDPPAGFEVAVLNGGEAWSAELQINESLINDWNHMACVKLGQYWITGVGDDRNWPAWSIWNSPASWADAWFGPSLPAQPNRAPVANAGSDRSAMTSTDISITLGGDGSYDPDGDPITYAWTQTEGPSVVFDDAASPTPTFTISPPADSVTLRFSLTVNDGQENSPPDEVEVVIYGSPTAMFLSNPAGGWAPLSVCFANHSSPNGHDITAYEWDFEGDGVMDSFVENPPCFKYERPGDYNPTLWIMTDLGYTPMRQRLQAKYFFPFDNADGEGWEPHPVAGGTYINDPLGAFYMAQTTTANPSEVGILNSPGNNVFGSWQQKVAAPMTDCGDGYLFRARYFLRTTQTDSAAVPQVRMRWNDASSLTFNMFV
ncbi:MAG TPA: hypothetical protein PLB62_11280, partial [Candidatus Sumerlaeota bacterium]|nr:hypothetical protein [Candidatus Sumerlaeota bacterium]